MASPMSTDAAWAEAHPIATALIPLETAIATVEEILKERAVVVG